MIYNENGFKQKISTLVSGAFLKCLSILSLIVPINNFYDISLKLQYTIFHNALMRLMLLSLSSNIPAAPAYGDYAVMKEYVLSIRTLLSAGKVLTTWLLSQGRGIKDQTGDNAEKVLCVAPRSCHSLQHMAVSSFISDALAIDKAVAYFLKTWACGLPDTTVLSLFRLMDMVGKVC